jgi:hypothetical protein
VNSRQFKPWGRRGSIEGDDEVAKQAHAPQYSRGCQRVTETRPQANDLGPNMQGDIMEVDRGLRPFDNSA